MNRKALIISNPGEVGDEHYCKGVFRDVENYRNFLESPIGGFWSSSEIVNLHKPTVAKVGTWLTVLNGFGYVLIIFTGHGWYSSERESTILQLSIDQYIDSVQLLKGAPKQTVILDCCREIHTSTSLSKMVIENAMATQDIHPEDCRQFYDHEIAECENGLVVAHSSKPGEVSGDDEIRGGYYSYSLIEKAKSWCNSLTIDTNTKYQTRSIVGIHEEAKENVLNLSGGRQEPNIEKPRTSKPYFPFCIVA